MIAKAEHLLFPGRIPTSDVAFLFPRSSFAWDVPVQSGNSAESCPHSTESPAGTAMDYAAVLAGTATFYSQVLLSTQRAANV